MFPPLFPDADGVGLQLADLHGFYLVLVVVVWVAVWVMMIRGRLARLLRFQLFTHFHSVVVDRSSQETIRTLIHKHCPSLAGNSASFWPTPWLFSGHLQTIYSAFGDFSKIDQVEYERRVIKVPDGGQIALDFTPPHRFSNKTDPTPVLVVLHGLTGGSHESYLRAVVAPLTKDHGWRAVVANFRGCAGAELTTTKLYNAGATEDIRLIIQYLTTILCPFTPLHAIGFSLGANVVAKYLGEEADRALIRSAVVVGNPWDLYLGHCFLESGFLGRIYSRALASNLRALMTRHLKVFKTRSSPIDVHALFANGAQSLYEFDSIVTRALGRFSSTEAYYKTQSSTLLADAIRVPLLSINALDDPIVTPDAIPIESALENPYLVMLVSRHGGHLGWFEGFWKPRRMIQRPIIEWFRAMNQAIQIDPVFGASHDLPRLQSPAADVEVLSVRKLGHPNDTSKEVSGTIQGL
ncbi:hypothetical protein PCASD_13110 [Puccinia coronata f. sp. avenae]|nr:hypothetical protein PCASD_24852 [Puccinia coronata f. sp. avenae]PLW35723.1 hypothetical protein PCASD_13110 [Puccinia coronata f. sp. avenae]